MIPWLLLPALTSAHAGVGQVVVETFSSPFEREQEIAGHVFGDRTSDLVLRVHGGSGRRISLEVQLFQLAHDLAAPVCSRREVATDLSLGDGPWHELELSLPFPAVQRVTRFQARYFCRGEGDLERHPVGQANWIVYPKDLMDPLRALSRQRRIQVHDPNGLLKGFLRAHEILFADADLSEKPRPADPARPSLLVCVAGDAQAAVSRSGASAPRESAVAAWLARAPVALVLQDSKARAPRTIVTVRREHTRVDLHARWLQNLASDPEAQTLLLEAFELALEHSR